MTIEKCVYWDHYKATCSEMYNCCSCGDGQCGCPYCYDCRKCEHCEEADKNE